MSDLEVTMMKRIGELNAEVKSLQAEVKRLAADTLKDLSLIDELKAEVERLTKAHSDALADFWSIHKVYFDLKAENERLRASSFVTAVPVEEYEKLKAEVERLRKFNDEALAHIAKEERKSRERLEIVQADVERLIKAGDAIESALREMPGDHPRCLANEWLAAKEDFSR